MGSRWFTGNDESRPRHRATPVKNFYGLAARLGRVKEVEGGGGRGLYSRGNAALIRGFNGEKSRAESTGVSRIEEQLTWG